MATITEASIKSEPQDDDEITIPQQQQTGDQIPEIKSEFEDEEVEEETKPSATTASSSIAHNPRLLQPISTNHQQQPIFTANAAATAAAIFNGKKIILTTSNAINGKQLQISKLSADKTRKIIQICSKANTVASGKSGLNGSATTTTQQKLPTQILVRQSTLSLPAPSVPNRIISTVANSQPCSRLVVLSKDGTVSLSAAAVNGSNQTGQTDQLPKTSSPESSPLKSEPTSNNHETVTLSISPKATQPLAENEVKFRCSLCDLPVAEMATLIRHVRHEHECNLLKCVRCKTPFNGELAFARHRSKCIQSASFACKQCKAPFRSKLRIEEHIREQHPEVASTSEAIEQTRAVNVQPLARQVRWPDLCPFCGKEFSRESDFDNHLRAHTGEKPFQCNTCLETFVNPSILIKHKSICENAGQMFTCPECKCSYNYKGVLDKHISARHPELLLRRKSNGTSTSTAVNGQPDQPVTPPKAITVKSNQPNSVVVLRNVNTTNGSASNEPTTSTLPKEEDEDIEEDTKEDISFDDNEPEIEVISPNDISTQELEKVMQAEYEEDDDTEEDEEKVDFASTLMETDHQHQQATPSTSTTIPFSARPKDTQQCPHCTYKFSLPSQLKHHLRNAHAGKAYQCDYCNKWFSTKGNLAMHRGIHAGYKPFTCEHCQKSFTQKCNLKVHLLTHTGLKQFTCETCKKNFSSKGNLTKHQLLHRGVKLFQCLTCSKQFATKGNLSAHEKTHSGLKPFTCELCKRKFSSKGNLTKHQVSHNYSSR